MKAGERVDRYVIEAELGRGGMGEVYEALDTKLARKVALKLVVAHADPTMTQRTLREARAAAALQHPNAVVVYDVGEWEGGTFIAMELVRGKPLRRFVGDETVPIGRRIRWLVDIAAALAAAHDAGLVHRDVKPDNVLIRDDGAVKVLDFGIARRPTKAIDPSAPTEADSLPTITERGMIVGTPQYASPEQLRGEAIDGRSDQFSWGVVSFELMSGKPPWRGGGEALALLSQVLSAEAPPLAGDIPAEVSAAIHKALSKSAADRFPDMATASEAIEPFASAPATTQRHGSLPDSGIKAATPPPTQVARLARRTGRIVYAGLAVIGGLLVAAIVAGAAMGTLKFDLHEHGADSAGAVPEGDVISLACKEADVEIEGPAPDDAALLKRAIGFGACARMAIELDADWMLEGGQAPAAVRAKLAPGKAEVTLTVQGKSATGHGKTPVDAINAATTELAKKVRAAPPTPDRIKAWGAKDAASAIRIERVWRRIVLNLLPNHMVAIRELLQTDAASPWPHAFAGLTFERGTAEQEAEAKKAIAMAEGLPSSRALGLRGILGFIESHDGQRGGLEALRKAYDEAPGDADIAGLFSAAAISVGNEEGWSVLDRLVASAPTRSIVPLENAVTAPRDLDLDRNERYLAKLHAILPETVGWHNSVRHLAQRGKIEEARQALGFGERFGLSVGDAAGVDETRLFVALVAEDAKAVREAGARLLGDPRPEFAASGAAASAWADLLDGNFEDALDHERQQIDRIRDHAGAHEIVAEVIGYTVQLRRLGKRPADPAILKLGTDAVENAKVLRPAQRAGLRGMFLVAAFEDPKKAKDKVLPILAEIEKIAEQAPNRGARESARLAGLALVRIAKGDAEAAKLWRETLRADHFTREGAALDAAFALEASGAKDEAKEVFTTTAGPLGAYSPLSRMISHIRLAELHRQAGDGERAAAEDAIVARHWKSVDPAILERIKKL